MGASRPILTGYQRVRESSPDRLENDLRVLGAFADREGYELGSVFTSAVGGPAVIEQLLANVGDDQVAAVGVPSEADLGGTARERAYVRAQLEAAGVRLLVAQVL